MADVEVDLSGPLFNGMAEQALRELRDEVVYDVTAQAKAEWMTNLNRSIRRPTPYYETQITMQTQGPVGVVHDRAVIYGPWLEGTSERNRTTRFKGYASLRRAVQTLRGKVPLITAHALARALQRMGGTP